MSELLKLLEETVSAIIRQNNLEEWLRGFGGFGLSYETGEYFMRFADQKDFSIVALDDGTITTSWLHSNYGIVCKITDEGPVCSVAGKIITLDEVIGYFSIDDIEMYERPSQTYDDKLIRMLTVYLHRRQIESLNLWKMAVAQ